MKKYMILTILVSGLVTNSFGQTKRELKKQARVEARLERKAAKEFKKNPSAMMGDGVEEAEVFVGDSLNPISWDATEIERKNIKQGTDDMFYFKFRNTGVKPIVVENVRTSCGCTTAEKPLEPVLPGEYGQIAVKYDTNRLSNFTKTVTIITNVTEPTYLIIKGNVLMAE